MNIGDKIFPIIAGEDSKNSWTIIELNGSTVKLKSDLSGIEKYWDYNIVPFVVLDPFPNKSYIEVKTVDDLFKLTTRENIKDI